MHKRRLLKLAGLLEADAKNPKGIRFDLHVWGEDRSRGKQSIGAHCGTAACALGLAALSGAFKRDGLRFLVEGYDGFPGVSADITVIHKGKDGLSAAISLFDLAFDEAEWIFTPAGYSGRITGSQGERKVAKRIRDFVADKARPD